MRKGVSKEWLVRWAKRGGKKAPGRPGDSPPKSTLGGERKTREVMLGRKRGKQCQSEGGKTTFRRRVVIEGKGEGRGGEEFGGQRKSTKEKDLL